MRTSPPSAFTSNRLRAEPGTRSMSPKEQKITSGLCAIATALSISSIGVTQTGQPGPCTSVISRGNRSSRPLFTIVWVCPPQISMIVQGRVIFSRTARPSCSAAFGSRYSLRNFTELLFQPAHFFQILEDALGFGFVNHADGEADMHQHVLADFDFGSVGQVDFLADAAEVNLAATEGNVIAVHDFNHPAGHGETHWKTSTRDLLLYDPRLMAACPRAIPPSFGGTCRCVNTLNPRSSKALAACSVR